MSEPIVIELKYPVTISGMTIEKLEIRKPKAKDFRSLNLDKPMSAMLDLAANLAGVPERAIDEIDGIEDLPKVLEVVGGFLDRFPATGTTSSVT